jgi:hypothetical protein
MAWRKSPQAFIDPQGSCKMLVKDKVSGCVPVADISFMSSCKRMLWSKAVIASGPGPAPW